MGPKGGGVFPAGRFQVVPRWRFTVRSARGEPVAPLVGGGDPGTRRGPWQKEFGMALSNNKSKPFQVYVPDQLADQEQLKAVKRKKHN